MMTTRFLSLAISFIIGILLALQIKAQISFFIFLPFILGGLYWSYVLFKKEMKWEQSKKLFVALAGLLIALPFGYLRTISVLSGPEKGSAEYVLRNMKQDQRITVQARVSSEPEMRGQTKGDIAIRIFKIKNHKTDKWIKVEPQEALLKVYFAKKGKKVSDKEIIEKIKRVMSLDAYGYKIEVETKVTFPDKIKNPGEFDYMEFLRQSGYITQLSCGINDVKILKKTKGNLIYEIALATKKQFLRTYKETIRNPASRFLSGSTLGTKRSLDNIDFQGQEVITIFRKSGVGHVLAVSGLHVSVITILFLLLLSSIGMNPRYYAPLIILILLIFTLVTGARPSTIRAAIMNSVAVVALAYFGFSTKKAFYIGISVATLVILIQNPLVLFAASFILSFSAVLSLVLITPVIMDWCKRTLRGFTMFFAFIWIILTVIIANVNINIVANPLNFLMLIGIFILLMFSGNFLNHRFPFFWKIGFERIPGPIRGLFFAQFAIQLGMMIPLNAWFFGQFPIAGMLVNLVAIPAIGVVVQLGMLVGLFGLIPGIGAYLAAPFGVAATLVGQGFMWASYYGANMFNYPATPQPTMTWMIGYYFAIGLLIYLYKFRGEVKSFMHKLVSKYKPAYNSIRVAFLVIPVIFILLPLISCEPKQDTVNKMTLYAAGKYPVISLVSENDKAILINGGSSFTGERVLFSHLRKEGILAVDKSIIPAITPDAGYAGVAALSNVMKVKNIFIPYHEKPVDNYLNKIGDAYLNKQIKRNKRWAKKYVDEYVNFLKTTKKNQIKIEEIQADKNFSNWKGLNLKILNQKGVKPRRFTNKGSNLAVHINYKGYKILVITDSHPDAIDKIFSGNPKVYDVVILPYETFPTPKKRKNFRRRWKRKKYYKRRYNYSNYKRRYNRNSSYKKPYYKRRKYKPNYLRLIDSVVMYSKPQAIIFTDVTRWKKKFDIEKWAGKQKNVKHVLKTSKTGALTFNAEDNKLVINCFLSGKTYELPKRNANEIKKLLHNAKIVKKNPAKTTRESKRETTPGAGTGISAVYSMNTGMYVTISGNIIFSKEYGHGTIIKLRDNTGSITLYIPAKVYKWLKNKQRLSEKGALIRGKFKVDEFRGKKQLRLTHSKNLYN